MYVQLYVWFDVLYTCILPMCNVICFDQNAKFSSTLSQVLLSTEHDLHERVSKEWHRDIGRVN